MLVCLAAMRILRLTNSDDINPRVAEGSRSPAVLERLFTEATGEPAETVLRIIWPDPALRGLIDGWLDRYHPDIVLFVVSSFWFTYESVPLKIERTFGPIGKPIAHAGLRAADNPKFAQSRIFHAGRRMALRTFGGATHFSPAEVVSLVESCVRSILARESAALVVRGPYAAFGSDAGARARRRAELRWRAVDEPVHRLCKQLHVEYIAFGSPVATTEDPALFQGDFVHVTDEGHQRRAEAEARAVIAAWRRLRGGVDAAR